MAVAINTSRMALDCIPAMQRKLDRVTGGGPRRYQMQRVSVHATLLSHNSEIERQLNSPPFIRNCIAKREAVDWQADPDDDLSDAAVLHHLHQQAATVPLLSSVISQSDCGIAVTTLTGSALSASTDARTQGRPLSSFRRFSCRLTRYDFSGPRFSLGGVCSRPSIVTVHSRPDSGKDHMIYISCSSSICKSSQTIVWAGPQRDNHLLFWQVQADVVDLFSRRFHTSRPPKRQRTAFNQFLQLSHSPVVDDTSRENPLPHAKRFNGVRHRPDRKIWVAEMKPPKHKSKQDFGNFKSEDEAARAVDAAFHHYCKPNLLNFPHTSLQCLSTRPTAPAGLDEKAKVKFVKEEAKLLLAAIAASSPLHSTHTSSLQILELSASPRRCPSGPFRSLSEISSPSSCSGPNEIDDIVAQPQPQILHDSPCDISTTGVLTKVETLNSVQNAKQGWDLAEDSCTLAAPANVGSANADESHSMWLKSIILTSPAPTYPRSPSPSHF